MQGFRRSSPIFLRLILAFIIILTPLFVIMLAFIDKGKEELRDKISESMMDRNTNVLHSLEIESERILRLLPEFVLDKDLLILAANGAELDDYDKVEKIQAIQRRLKLVKQSSPFISEVKTYIPSIDRTILSSQYLTSINVQEFTAMAALDSHEGSLVSWEGRLWIRFRYGGGLNNRPLFVQSVELSLPEMTKLLSDTNRSLGISTELVRFSADSSISTGNDPERTEWLKSRLQKGGDHAGIEYVSYHKEPYMVVYRKSLQLGMYMVSFIPESSLLGELRKYETRLWILFAVSLTLIVIFSYWIYRIIHKPLKKLVVTFKSMKNGHLRLIEVPRRNDEFAYLYQGYNDMVGTLDDLIREVYHQKIISQRHELKRLQSQINPHFLYNCLFVLNQLILSGELETSYRFSLFVGQYFQFMTRDGADEIPLQAEIAHSQTYINIQKICFADRVDVCIPEQISFKHAWIIPRLIVQPVIENAYKYAFGNKHSGGKLRIHVNEDETGIAIHIEDNGDNLTDLDILKLQERVISTPGNNEDISGLHNVHRRIQLKFGQESGISLGRSSLGGLRVSLLFKVAPTKNQGEIEHASIIGSR
ncbi:sensor histidine kinase [Paenibacillus sp. GCM10023248]|uniref:sensor histidine kinase n=1 Tax=Bacillales TaxID=1385 RepID=UPI00237941FB|nr:MULTISPECIES: histidine kinase [Bacillales]MDD9265465.1 histidine kinase [Paenibacillus sp. MAHUQ-63]MDR6882500.1 two-component system sensor histidine kinase YesM [Bacillus sp. 3255]